MAWKDSDARKEGNSEGQENSVGTVTDEWVDSVLERFETTFKKKFPRNGTKVEKLNFMYDYLPEIESLCSDMEVIITSYRQNSGSIKSLELVDGPGNFTEGERLSVGREDAALDTEPT